MLRLYIGVPRCALRKPFAKDYGETYTVPPFSTVLGLLCSYLGEMNPSRYAGVQMALGMVSYPVISEQLVRQRREKDKKDPTSPKNIRMDMYETLSPFNFMVGLQGDLARDMAEGMAHPERITRFGPVCLGASHWLVDTIDIDDATPARWLLQCRTSKLRLPVWQQRGEAMTWGRFTELVVPTLEIPEEAWVTLAHEDQTLGFTEVAVKKTIAPPTKVVKEKKTIQRPPIIEIPKTPIEAPIQDIDLPRRNSFIPKKR